MSLATRGLTTVSELVARYLLGCTFETPLPNATDIYVDEIGVRIIADPAPMKQESGFAHLVGVHPGHPNINGLSLHV